MKEQNVTHPMKSLVDSLKMFEGSRERNYSISKMRQWLGDEPWDCNTVLQLYMKNHMNMEKILNDHEGYRTYLDICKLRNLLLKLNMYKTKIIDEIDNCNRLYFVNDNNNEYNRHKTLIECQNSVNLFFYGYASLCYTIKEYQGKILYNKYSCIQYKISSIFDECLNNGCHRCLMMLRHKLNHGVMLNFELRVDITKKVVSFSIKDDVMKNIEANDKKDNDGLTYLIQLSGCLDRLLLNNYEMMSKFCTLICESLFIEKKEAIHKCNLYYKKILNQVDIQFQAIARSVDKNTQMCEIKETETYYLDRAMGHLS